MSQSIIDLSGSWRLSSLDEETQALMPIPGDVHTALKKRRSHSRSLLRP